MDNFPEFNDRPLLEQVAILVTGIGFFLLLFML